MKSLGDTIVAVSTPPGPGGIGVVRLSGPRALEIGRRIFHPKRPELVGPRRVSYGTVGRSREDIIDQALSFFIPGPQTMTGQDVFEIQAHGGPLALDQVVKLCLAGGARLAEPGEFTYRAYMAGKIDLTQAEAVVELVNAKTATSSRLAAGQMAGALRERIEELEALALEVLSGLEAGIDFSEEEAEDTDYPAFIEAMGKGIIPKLEEMMGQTESARLLREGPRVALAGRVNAGKSSLLNSLCRHKRAIISETPGTTRDYLEAEIEVGGLPLTLIDTAGLRDESEVRDQIEAEGQRLTRDIMDEAWLTLDIIDSTDKDAPGKAEAEPRPLSRRNIPVFNKIDLLGPEELGLLKERAGRGCVFVSAKTGTGLDELRLAMRERILGQGTDLDSLTFLPNQRQAEALGQALRAFREALGSMRRAAPPEVVAVDLREGLEALQKTTGEALPERILEKIFAKFCIGK